MAEIWFISGPPFDVAIWRAVEARVRDLGFTTRAWPCLMAGSGDIAEEVARLKADLEAAADDVLLVGHGSALPLIRAVGTHAKVSGLVLSNGPGETADRLSRLWTRVFSIPPPLRKSLLSPTVVMPFLQSSLGLRRTVVNPYVMDPTRLSRFVSQFSMTRLDESAWLPTTNPSRTSPSSRSARTSPCCFAGEMPTCLLYTSPSPRDATLSRMPSSA